MTAKIGLFIITPDNRQFYQHELNDYFRLRKEVLIDKLGWDLHAFDGKEIDQFDHNYAHYLLYKSFESGKIIAGVRLTPTLAPNLTLDVFSDLIDSNYGFKRSPNVWESSRFITSSSESGLNKVLVREITLLLFMGMLEYGLYNKIHSFVTLTEVRLERIGRMVGWQLNRLGKVQQVGNTYAVVGLIEVSEQIQNRIGEYGNVKKESFYPSLMALNNNDPQKISAS